MRNPFIILFVCAVIACCPTMAYAQDDIETDRPDQTETATTVPPGAVQIETGFVYESTTTQKLKSTVEGSSFVDAAERTYSLPTALVRVGLTAGFELRIEGGYEIWEVEYPDSGQNANSFDVVSQSGIVAPSVGLKAELVRADGWIPDIAFIADVTLPYGSEDFRPAYVAPAFRMTFAHELGESFSLAYNLGAEWDGETAGGAGIYTLALGWSVFDNLGSYIELFGEMPAGSRPSHNLDGGLAFRPMPHLQFDVSAGIGLTETAPDYYIAAGASIRIPE